MAQVTLIEISVGNWYKNKSSMITWMKQTHTARLFVDWGRYFGKPGEDQSKYVNELDSGPDEMITLWFRDPEIASLAALRWC